MIHLCLGILTGLILLGFGAPVFAQTVVVTATVAGRLVDHDNVDPNDMKDFHQANSLTINDDLPHVLFNFDECVDQEVRLHVSLNAIRSTGGTVRIQGRLDLYEGTDCSTTDVEGPPQSVDFVVPLRTTQTLPIQLPGAGAGWVENGVITVSTRPQ